MDPLHWCTALPLCLCLRPVLLWSVRRSKLLGLTQKVLDYALMKNVYVLYWVVVLKVRRYNNHPYQLFELYCLLVATPELFSFYKSELTLDILFPKANNKSDSVLNFVQTFPNLIQYHCFLVWSYMTKIHFSFDSITIPFHWTFFF